MQIDTYEIKLLDEQDEIPILDNILYECQCALFLLDITNSASLEQIKKVMKTIDKANYNYLTTVLVSTKSDQDENRVISNFEVKEFTDQEKNLETIEVSAKENKKIDKLYDIIYTALNNKKSKLPCNIITQNIVKTKPVRDQLSQETPTTLTLVLLGDSEVGKTSFSNRFFQNTFAESFLSSIGIDNDSVFVKVNEELFKLTIWDTAGQERFRSLPKKYYQNADGILLLYDVTKQETFDNITTWMKDIKDNTNKQTTEDGQTSSNNELTIFLIGNKFDKTDERVVSKDKAEALAKNLGMQYHEVSCKLNMNITETINKMILECYTKVTGEQNIFQLKKEKENGTKKESGGCC